MAKYQDAGQKFAYASTELISGTRIQQFLGIAYQICSAQYSFSKNYFRYKTSNITKSSRILVTDCSYVSFLFTEYFLFEIWYNKMLVTPKNICRGVPILLTPVMIQSFVGDTRRKTTQSVPGIEPRTFAVALVNTRPKEHQRS